MLAHIALPNKCEYCLKHMCKVSTCRDSTILKLPSFLLRALAGVQGIAFVSVADRQLMYERL